MKPTQPLPSSDSAASPSRHDTHPLSGHWRRARPALLLFAGGATCAWLASGLMSHAISTQAPPRSLPTAKSKPTPGRMSREEWRRQNPGDARFLDSAGVSTSRPDVEASVLPALTADGVPSVSGAAVEVADSNEDGTAWKGFVARSDEDRRRLSDRREEDRMLQERRALESQKRRIERELEVKALQEKYRAEDKQAIDAVRQEDKGRIQSRVDEDRQQSEQRSGQQLAEAPTAVPQQ